MSTGNIESVLSEERLFNPSRGLCKPRAIERKTAGRAAPGRQQRSGENVGGTGAGHADWHKPFTATLDRSRAPHFSWFADGELNASEACLGPWIEKTPDRPAILYEGEEGDSRTLTYGELGQAVERFGSALRNQGVSSGDRVVIYMPMCPEAIIAMHACARIGAVHSVVFGGFSARSLYDRVVDASAQVIITADAGRRGGKLVHLKAAVDRSLEYGEHDVRRVIVFRHSGADIQWCEGRDLWAHELTESLQPDCPAEYVNAEHPLFLLYTSGSTGKPRASNMPPQATCSTPD